MLKYLKKMPPICIVISVCLLALLLKKIYRQCKENMENADLKVPKKEQKSDKLSNKEQKLVNEGFGRPKRYMYQSSGIKRNSSWDLRGEDSLIKYQPEKTGIFNEGDYKNNYTNKK